MKLRTRILAVALALSLLFGLTLTATMLVRAFHRNLDAELDRGVRSSGMFAASLQASLNAFSALGDEESARRAIRITAGYMTELAMVAVLDDTGQLQFDNFPLSMAPLMDLGTMAPGSYTLLKYAGEPYQLIHRQVDSSAGSFSLLYAWSLQDVYAGTEAQTRQAMLLILLLGALLAAALMAAMRASFRPLHRLERATQRIAEGDYTARAPETRTQDEVGRLAVRFNAMAEATQAHVFKLEERDASQRQFIADMAHELKTPLTSMIGYADLMRRSPLQEDSRHRALDAIVTQGERLERMRDKLLSLARLDGGQPPAMQPAAAADILQEAAAGLEEPLRQKQLILQVLADEAVWHCDRDLVIALAQNLLSNAVKASSPGQRIWLSAAGPVLSVRDEGEGIPPEHLNKVTEAFYMVDKSRARSEQGAGLGLALCRRIAQLHGARLEIDSEPGRGTEVRLCFTSP